MRAGLTASSHQERVTVENQHLLPKHHPPRHHLPKRRLPKHQLSGHQRLLVGSYRLDGQGPRMARGNWSGGGGAQQNGAGLRRQKL